MIKVQPDLSDVRDMLKEFTRGKELARVIGRTLNRTRASTKSASSRLLRKRINLKKSVIDQAIDTRRGTQEIQTLSALAYGRAWFEIIWSGSPFPLRDFGASKNSRGVSFKVSRQSRRKVYELQGRKGFILPSRGGHVFVRTGPNPPGPKKAPIKKVYGPSIPQFAVTKREQRAIIEHARKFWGEELTRNLRFALERRNRRK